jgi:hypothetical protein
MGELKLGLLEALRNLGTLPPYQTGRNRGNGSDQAVKAAPQAIIKDPMLELIVLNGAREFHVGFELEMSLTYSLT